jgi:hypothetical protein
MDLIVHFTVGLAGGLSLLLFVEWCPRRKFLAMFASGGWAMVPDGHWILRGVGFDTVAAAWRSIHDSSALVDVFWFHRLLDLNETGQPKLETAVALAVLSVVVVVYYVANDWDDP